MKVYRGPQTGGRWTETDSAEPQMYMKEWHPGAKISFNGTIDGAMRFTEVGVEMEEADILALSQALVKWYGQQRLQLSKEVKSLRTEGARMKEGLRKISSLIRFHSAEAPSEKELLDAVKTIAQHYRWGEKRNPKIPWIKWHSI